jgi:hypothetical protein
MEYLYARAQTWANYKHNNTIKFLVSVTPTGAISYVSKAFGGRTSDKVINIPMAYETSLGCRLQIAEQMVTILSA